VVDTGCVACQNTWEQDYTSKITQTPTVDGGDAKVCLPSPRNSYDQNLTGTDKLQVW